jgi:carboxypeptidase C (cathepsin A)
MNFRSIFLLFSTLLSFSTILISGLNITNEAQTDLVTNLPGLNQDIVQFSGYLNISTTKKKIHYWFVQSESDPANDPVVFWTNGGPGCSGLLGLLTEQGPFKPDATGNLIPNKWRWNRVANMVFVEQPVGVGYSYSSDSNDYHIGDDQAAKDNLQLVLSFFKKFPEYKSNPLFITSESYGGHYMPTWAKEIVEYNKAQPTQSKINFAGFAVGNPYVDYYSGSGAEMEALNAREMLPKPSWDKYVSQGCTNPVTMLNNSVCSTLMLDFMHITSNSNPYALDYSTCVTAQQSQMSDFIHERIKVQSGFLGTKMLAHPGIPLADDYEPCEDDYASIYMNRPDVKAALHVNPDIIWDECSRTIKYEMVDKMKSVIHIYKELLDDKEAGIRMLIYSGDDDGVCATSYTQHMVWDILNYKPSSYWKLWKVDGQTGGYITEFNTPWDSKSRLAFSTVHFAGHEVPTYKPKEAFVLFNAFINNDYKSLLN